MSSKGNISEGNVSFRGIFKSSTASQRYTLFPLKWKTLWDFYKRHEAAFWTAEEIRLTDDLADWNDKLTDSERYFIKHVLAFFAGSDGIVNENLVVNFYNEIESPEARNFYTIQMMMETIHSETYALLIDTYIRDSTEKEHLFAAIDTIPAIKKKADWALKWISEGSGLVSSIPTDILDTLKSLENKNELSLEEQTAIQFFTKDRPNILQRLVAFICVEGIFFSGSFCAIYWLKNRGLLPGLATANEFISRDENLHCEFAIELYKMAIQESSDNFTVPIQDIFKEAVSIEQEFVRDSLPVSLIGMNERLMCQYIEYVADRWLVMMGHSKLYHSKNPFAFMEMISINEKSNFFETVNSSYQKANVGTSETDRVFSLDEDF